MCTYKRTYVVIPYGRLAYTQKTPKNREAKTASEIAAAGTCTNDTQEVIIIGDVV
jgi:hypothetical protein